MFLIVMLVQVHASSTAVFLRSLTICLAMKMATSRFTQVAWYLLNASSTARGAAAGSDCSHTPPDL